MLSFSMLLVAYTAATMEHIIICGISKLNWENGINLPILKITICLYLNCDDGLDFVLLFACFLVSSSLCT